MKASWRKHLGARAPRYTSYPSALQFEEGVSAEAYAARLGEIGLYAPLSIYVHVPFCRTQCWYCGCNMRVENSYERALDYVRALVDEIRIVGGFLGGRGRPVALHFGGGTPNYLLTEDLEKILDAVEMELGLTDDARLAIEIDPRLVGERDFLRLAELGFSRVSIGVQDFDTDVQAAINRVTDFETVERCVSAARDAGIDDISFDLLYGLPKQTPRSFRDTLEKAVALGPERMAVFGYAHLPKALPRQQLIHEADLPDADMRAALVMMADEFLVDVGYAPVGFDHYARPGNALAEAARAGRLKRNFQGFTDDAAEATIGLGASAVGFVSGLYVQNEKDIADYKAALAAGRLPIARGIAREACDEAWAGVIEDLLCHRPANIEKGLAFASPGAAQAIDLALARFEDEGVIERVGAKVRMRDDARPLARIVAAAIDPRAGAASAFSRAL